MTMPVRGFGQKNVVFGGIRSPPWAVRAIWETVAGRQKTAAFASPVLTASRAWAISCSYVRSCSGNPARAASMRLESRS